MSHRHNQEANWALWEQYNPRTGNWLSDTKDIILRFLQDFFYQMPAGQQPSLFHFEPLDPTAERTDDEAYQSDELATELIITDAGTVNTETVEKRPCIVVSRGAFAYGNTSMDHLLSINSSDGKETRTDLLTGSFVLHCISREGLEAERLAVIVARAIRYFRLQLQKAGFFNIGTIVQVGSESSPGQILSGDSEEDFVDVPVSFPVYYQESWTNTPEAVALSQITLTAYAVFRDFYGDLVSPDALDGYGNPVEASEGVLVGAWTYPSTG